MRLPIFFLLLLLAFSSAVAQRGEPKGLYLQPEDGPFPHQIFAQYYRNLNYVLFKPLKSQPLLQMVVIPSFQPEWASGIVKQDSEFSIFSSISSLHIWQYETLRHLKSGAERIIYSPKSSNLDSLQASEIKQLDARLPSSLDAIQVDYSSSRISKDFYDLIADAWFAVLKRVRYDPSELVGFDGVDYHFSLLDPERAFISGKTWSPADSTLNSLTVQLGLLLKSYSQRGGDSDLRNDISHISQRILQQCKDACR